VALDAATMLAAAPFAAAIEVAVMILLGQLVNITVPNIMILDGWATGHAALHKSPFGW